MEKLEVMKNYTSNEICDLLPDVNEKVLKATLIHMNRKGVINRMGSVKEGAYNVAIYSVGNKPEEVKQDRYRMPAIIRTADWYY